jgi:glycosyltransferase involved in cell wall biosynthesis
MRPDAKRIVIFAPHFAEYSTRLALGLAKRCPVLLALDRINCRAECDDDLMREARSALTVLEFDSVGRSNRIKSLLLIAWRVLIFRPSLIYVQEQIDSLTAWVVRVLSLVFRIVLTVHDPKPHSGADTDYVIANAGNRRTIRAAACGFHVHGAFCKIQLVSVLGGQRPIVETAHGIVLAPHPDERRDPEPSRILMFGRMEAYKGLETLLDAADELVRRNVHYHLVLAGRGPEIDRLAPRIGTMPDVEMKAAFLPPADAIAEFQRAALVVVPYLDATQSGVVAAAFGNGRPVVASRTGGLVDAVQDKVSGLFFEPGNSRQLADILEVLLSDTEYLGRLRSGARGEAAGKFNWDFIASQLPLSYPLPEAR